jgi:membrane-bound lytic murein transglycosylase F
MGFEYELAKEFADYLGVKLDVRITEDWEEMIPILMNGTGTFIAAGMTITPKRQRQTAFSDGYMDIQQHIISRRNGAKIEKPEDLAGKTIHVRTATSYQERLEELQKQGIEFTIRLHRDLPTEELIQQVAKGEIEFTVANSNIALLNRRHYPGAIMAGAISDQQKLGWAVHPEAVQLREKINLFFKIIKKNGRDGEIYNKYYGDVANFDYVDLSIFHRRIKTRLSRYSPFIKAAAKKHGFDWRLISAQIYQESHLNPFAKSPAGAKGLMQLLTSTAESLGVQDIYDPVENINAGVQHLRNLYELFDSVNGTDRILISLAAYNIGQGHIRDARDLAVKMNLDPNSWESLSATLPLLSLRKYYKDSKYGYCRGAEPVLYIKQIMVYYDILKKRGVEQRELKTKVSKLNNY